MSIQSLVTELDNIKAEIKRNNEMNKCLRLRAKTVENDIKDYLGSKDQEGVRYRDQSFVLEHSLTYKRKGKKDKEDATVRLLQNMGIRDTGTVYKDLLAVQKGDEIETVKLRVTKNKKNIY